MVLLHGFWAIPRSQQKWVERYEGRAHRRLTDPLYAPECVEAVFSEVRQESFKATHLGNSRVNHQALGELDEGNLP